MHWILAKSNMDSLAGWKVDAEWHTFFTKDRNGEQAHSVSAEMLKDEKIESAASLCTAG